jgi:CHASE3 domain sensor protein
MTKSVLNRTVLLAFGSAILVLFVIGAISYRALGVSEESDRWVRHTHEVLEKLQVTSSAVQATESSYRQFALTGSEEYVELFHEGVLRSEQTETAVRDLTADNATQQRQFVKLDRLAYRRNDFAETIIDLRRAKGLEAAADAIRSGKGRQISEEFDGIVREMQNEEERLLVLRIGTVFVGLNSFVFRVADTLEDALQAFRFACLAHFASMPYQLMRKQNPFFLGNHLDQVLFDLLRIGVFRQIKPPR